MVINLISKILREVNYSNQIDYKMFRFIIDRQMVETNLVDDFHQQKDVSQEKQFAYYLTFYFSNFNRKSYFNILNKIIFSKRAHWSFVDHFRDFFLNKWLSIVIDSFGKEHKLVVN